MTLSLPPAPYSDVQTLNMIFQIGFNKMAELTSILSPTLPKDHLTANQWGGLANSSRSLMIAELSYIQKPLLIITPDIQSAELLQTEYQFFRPNNLAPIYFPDKEILPYDMFSPHQDIISERLRVLATISDISSGIIITSLPSLLSYLPPKQHVINYSLQLQCSQTINIESFREKLINSGYINVNQVLEHGEFLVRGSILDIYPMGSKLPIRVELFDNTITTLRTFNTETQITIEKVDSINILPANEYALTEDAISTFRMSWRATFKGNPLNSPVYEAISEGRSIAGIEAYLPLFFDETCTLFDYLPNNTVVMQYSADNNKQALQAYWEDIEHRYEQHRYDITRPCLPPKDLFLSSDLFFQKLKPYQLININDNQNKNNHIDFQCDMLPKISESIKSSQPMKKLSEFIGSFNGRALITADSTGRQEIMMQQLHKAKIDVTVVSSWQEFLSSDAKTCITTSYIQHGFKSQSSNIALISESDCYLDFVSQRRTRKKPTSDAATFIKSLAELSINDYIVHIDHGIGQYLGLTMINTGNIQAEYLTLVYENEDKIFVPVTSLHLISRYASHDNEHVQLHKLGSAIWDRQKKKAIEKINDIAAELLELYAKRASSTGHKHEVNQDDYQSFRQSFPFEETPDQLTAIDAVVQDMASKISMDRLVCGDVGFGKTEIAMQAAFIAANDGSQVALLVPTTLLAEQHYQSFCDRFSKWPISIGVISRMHSSKQQALTLKNLAEGKVDIIIGTHKLLQKNIKFNSLGLMIVDEEHRFGVKQKEQIKSIRAEVDLLTLTATPIPRTLNMALSGSRDLSIIATPPMRRLAIKTFLHKFQSSIISEAIKREILRGGQLYFLHNNVSTIHIMKEKLLAISPNAKIAIAHGQMKESFLEQTMTDFYHQKYNILLCTTIIESGIDVPSANTIIINNANKFGLAQLHQIRGRVGRSHHQAYAYLLVDEIDAISLDAQKRLDAFLSLEDLGAGFNLATHDLEIRGAGELLGDDQSGHMQSIGYSLYMEMLETAIEAIKTNKKSSDILANNKNPDIDCGITAIFPETFIPDVTTRMSLYKRINDCKSDEELNDLHVEIIDRFGLPPSVTESLLEIQRLKIIAKSMGITKIEAKAKYGYITFSSKPLIDHDQLLHLLQNNYKKYSMHKQSGIRFTLTADDGMQEQTSRLDQVKLVLEDLSGPM